MARKYGKDTDAAKNASEEVSNIRQGDVELQSKIEKGIGAGCAVVALIILIASIATAIRLGNETRNYKQSVEQRQSELVPVTTVSENESVAPVGEVGVDTVEQRYRVSNMYDAGQAVANEQNRLIAEIKSGNIKKYTESSMSNEILSTYVSDPSKSAGRCWAWDLVESHPDVNYVWVFSTDYDFENSYTEGSSVQDKSQVTKLPAVWRLYEETDAASQNKLIMYVVGVYNCGSPQGNQAGYFTDVKVYGLTGWGVQAKEQAEVSDVDYSNVSETDDMGAPADRPGNPVRPGDSDSSDSEPTGAPVNDSCGEPDCEPSDASDVEYDEVIIPDESEVN